MTYQTVHGSADKLARSQDGNILMTMIFILMIMGAVGYYMTATDQVDLSLRNFSSTQATSYLKVDIRETLRKTLLGTNTECDPVFMGQMKKFRNFLTTQANAQASYNLTEFVSAPGILKAHCFLHPESYGIIKIAGIQVRLYRTGAPNYVSLSTSVSADVLVKIADGNKITTQKYILRYRIVVQNLNHYGIIFDSNRSEKLITITDKEAKVRLNSNVLVDQRQPAFSRTGNYPLRLLLPDNTGSLHVSRRLNVAAQTLTLDTDSEPFMQGNLAKDDGSKTRMQDIFRYGIELNALQNITGNAPYQVNTPTQWNDVVNYEFLGVDSYPIPKMKLGTSAIPISGDISYTFNMDKDKNAFNTDSYKVSGKVSTEKIYEKLTGNKNNLFQSCNAADIGSSRYPLFIFNNFGEDPDPSFGNGDLIIDFTGNTDATSAPPVFCGVIAAKNLIIKLNNDPATKHQIFGKIILKGNLRIEGKGELDIYDISDSTNDHVIYSVPNMDDLLVQFFNQKYYATQNFHLPFFKSGSIYSVSSDPSCGTDPFYTCARDRYYVPRALREFFRKDVTYIKNPFPNQMTGKRDGVIDCKNSAGLEFYCRTDSIVSPNPPEDLITRWGNNLATDDLLYEVFIAE